MAKSVKSADRPLRLSWSAIQSFLSCQRKYDLTYNENLQRKPSAAHRNLLLGSAFHAGVEAALQAEFEFGYHQMAGTTPVIVQRADAAATAYLETQVVHNKMIRDYQHGNGGNLVLDTDYYAMIREVSQLVLALLRFHIPLIGLGDRYTVPTVEDVVSGLPPAYRHVKGEEPVPAIEWHFEYPMDDNTILSGYIDTVLWDNEAEEYLLVDWKTRGGFPHDSMALIDGQLHLYAAVVNNLSEPLTGKRPISRVLMWQMKTKTPSPASISKKTNLPNTGAQSYDTTWDHWVATLPRGIKAADYEEVMRPKMKEPTEFQRPVSGAVTGISSQLALDNVTAAVASIRAAMATGQPLAAILSSDKCKTCDFAMLCTNVLRFGGDASTVLDEHYQPRKADAIDETLAAED